VRDRVHARNRVRKRTWLVVHCPARCDDRWVHSAWSRYARRARCERERSSRVRRAKVNHNLKKGGRLPPHQWAKTAALGSARPRSSSALVPPQQHSPRTARLPRPLARHSVSVRPVLFPRPSCVLECASALVHTRPVACAAAAAAGGVRLPEWEAVAKQRRCTWTRVGMLESDSGADAAAGLAQSGEGYQHCRCGCPVDRWREHQRLFPLDFAAESRRHALAQQARRRKKAKRWTKKCLRKHARECTKK
jgi:hypothetical protein